MKKLILASLLSLASLLAQGTGSNIVSIIAFPTTVRTSGAILTKGPLQNIGQTSHTFNVVITQSTLVSGATLQLGIQASSDGVNYFNISPVPVFTISGAEIVGPKTFTVNGYGSYPYLQVIVSYFFNSGGGQVTFFGQYTGTSSPASIASDGLAYISNTATAGGTVPVHANTSLVASPNSFTGVAVYGLYLNLPSTATSFTMQCLNGAGTATEVFDVPNTGTSIINIVLPISPRPYFYCGVGGLLQYTFGGTGNAGLNVYYRYE